ncbi:hypothetical protein OJAV_G00198510 [Oryzias javanicus]|uniref:Gypsy retrotransposon integrase-like protein 1 n=1 Tax=Oryzias javanicus TaxID=123683 RepID=A0A3S2MGG9_ORYJA|nr:hypothetical protein OJAV_G00198510 [Oryzias javanicus]
MNVLRKCCQELFGQHGTDMFEPSLISGVPESVVEALQQCHHVLARESGTPTGRVKVKGKKVCRIPGGTMKLVGASCSEQYSGCTVLFDPSDCKLPAGLLASPSLVEVVRGTTYVPIVNVGSMDVSLHPRTLLGTLDTVHVVSLPAGVTEEAAVRSQAVSQTVPAQIGDIDLSRLSAEEQEEVRSLLSRYSSVFSAHDGDLGCTNLISHDIPLLDDTPVRQRYRRIPPSEYEVVKEHINQLLKTQIIRESCSPYASPIVLVKKKDGSLRMCVDYRPLNAKTRKDAFPLPRIEETLDSLTGACWFSTMDLASGYNQVPVTETDRPKTAFCTPFGLFEWNRMPFGLCNAPSTFQRLMQRLFGDQQGQTLLLYLDDIVVFSSSIPQHLERLEVVLSRLQLEGLKVKLSKCSFLKREVQYLGHVISDKGVSTDPAKLDAVAKWPRPTTTTELRSFLGFASYYRRFVEGFAQLAAPLHRLAAAWNERKPNRSPQNCLDVDAVVPGTSVPPALQQVLRPFSLDAAHAPVAAFVERSPVELSRAQQADGTIKAVLEFWRRQRRPNAGERRQLSPSVLTLLKQWDRLHEVNGVLYRQVWCPDGAEPVMQLVLPSSLKNEVLTQVHQEHGHQGIERTLSLVRSRCYWPGMASEVTQWCQRCERCQLGKDAPQPALSLMGHLLASRPNEILAIDYTLLEPARNGVENVLVITDVFSKYTLAIPTRDQRASTVAQVLVQEWFSKFGVPARIHSDQGRSFESALIAQLCSLYGIQKSRTTPYHPAGNGQPYEYHIDSLLLSNRKCSAARSLPSPQIGE